MSASLPSTIALVDQATAHANDTSEISDESPLASLVRSYVHDNEDYIFQESLALGSASTIPPSVSGSAPGLFQLHLEGLATTQQSQTQHLLFSGATTGPSSLGALIKTTSSSPTENEPSVHSAGHRQPQPLTELLDLHLSEATTSVVAESLSQQSSKRALNVVRGDEESFTDKNWNRSRAVFTSTSSAISKVVVTKPARDIPLSHDNGSPPVARPFRVPSLPTMPRKKLLTHKRRVSSSMGMGFTLDSSPPDSDASASSSRSPTPPITMYTSVAELNGPDPFADFVPDPPLVSGNSSLQFEETQPTQPSEEMGSISGPSSMIHVPPHRIRYGTGVPRAVSAAVPLAGSVWQPPVSDTRSGTFRSLMQDVEAEDDDDSSIEAAPAATIPPSTPTSPQSVGPAGNALSSGSPNHFAHFNSPIRIPRSQRIQEARRDSEIIPATASTDAEESNYPSRADSSPSNPSIKLAQVQVAEASMQNTEQRRPITSHKPQSPDKTELANRPSHRIIPEMRTPSPEESSDIDLLPMSQGRKRKREASPVARPSSGRPKRIKRMASAAPSRSPEASPPSSSEPTRIFALWPRDSRFYPGTVVGISSTSSTKYLIEFDDGSTTHVDIKNLRQCELEIGDYVDVCGGEHQGVGRVVETEDWDESRSVRVEMQDEEEVDVLLQHIRLHSKRVDERWNGRMLASEQIVIRPSASGEARRLPSSSATNLHTTRGNRNLFRKVGFIITSVPSQGDSKRRTDKESTASELNRTIPQCGGRIFSDWTELLSFGGQITPGKRWVGGKSQVRWVAYGRPGDPDPPVEKIFLLSDRATGTEKYLLSLALGIPCVSTRWVLDCIQLGTVRPWHAYLLSAGYCEQLSTEVSQFVDPNWGQSVGQLHNLMDSAVTRRPFTGISVLCIGPKFKVKGILPEHAISRLACAMGAERVEAVTELIHASQALDQYDYVIGDPCSAQLSVKIGLAKLVDKEWVKQAILTGALMDLSSA